jgi:hypothetical protein
MMALEKMIRRTKSEEMGWNRFVPEERYATGFWTADAVPGYRVDVVRYYNKHREKDEPLWFTDLRIQYVDDQDYTIADLPHHEVQRLYTILFEWHYTRWLDRFLEDT